MNWGHFILTFLCGASFGFGMSFPNTIFGFCAAVALLAFGFCLCWWMFNCHRFVDYPDNVSRETK